MRKNILDALRERVLVFDGAMGTMLQKAGLKNGESPEEWNITNPEKVKEIHRLYLEAGSNIVNTNTFGGSRYKLDEYGLGNKVYDINYQAVVLAREVCGEDRYVAASIGPTGKLIEPFGELTFENAYAAFSEQVKAFADAGADLINIETMSDLQEARAALLAAKDNSKIPVICNMTFEPSLRTVMGTDPATAVTVLSGMGAEIIGANCSAGPKELLDVIKIMGENTSAFLSVKPNAGLPLLIDGRTVFPETPEGMAEYISLLIEAGANIIGGCCGTTPEHIKVMAEKIQGKQPRERINPSVSRLASRTQTIIIDEQPGSVIIGERINPTARKKMAAEIKEGKSTMVRAEAITQVEAGAKILDVNVGVPGIDEPAVMRRIISEVQNTVPVPLVIDSTNSVAIEAALKAYAGKALINSVNGEEKSLSAILPLAKKYGAAVLGLALDESGIPPKAEGRLAIAEKIFNRATELGISREDIYIDCLVLTASAQQAEAMETIKAIKMVKEKLGVKTILGLSNISYGLPRRDILNSTFLALAIGAGLDMPIANPFDMRIKETIMAAAVLTNRDKHALHFINWANENPITQVNLQQNNNVPKAEKTVFVPANSDGMDNNPLYNCVLKGDKENVVAVLQDTLKDSKDSMEIMNGILIPAMEQVGKLYESGTYFLPQMMLSAETMKKAFNYLKSSIGGDDSNHKGKVVIATVKGDIHDIGKNIVATLLENNGFKVIDLGKDVAKEQIIESVKSEQADLVALSALMTTTMPEMKNVKDALLAENIEIPVLIGGAVVTANYAQEICAYYAKDAVQAVETVKGIIIKK